MAPEPELFQCEVRGWDYCFASSGEMICTLAGDWMQLQIRVCVEAFSY